MTDLIDLAGKSVIVTGASSGIGASGLADVPGPA
jgi:NADP-dependent 3-hydroxy acid dehydrogenase YdfG